MHYLSNYGHGAAISSKLWTIFAQWSCGQCKNFSYHSDSVSLSLSMEHNQITSLLLQNHPTHNTQTQHSQPHTNSGNSEKIYIYEEQKNH